MSETDKKVPVIIDTDAGSDDVLALILALQCPELDVRCITTVLGNVDVDQATENILRILHFFNRTDIPVYEGCYSSMLGHHEQTGFHGSDGLSGASTDYPLPPDVCKQEEHATSAMIRLVKQEKQKITLVALGPLTNVAMAHRLNPEFLRNLKRLVIMGGNSEGKGNTTATAEFNFGSDDNCSVGDQCPMTIVPWETCTNTSTLTWEWSSKWMQKDTPVAKLIRNVTSFPIAKCMEAKQSAYFYCDLLAMTVVVHPEVVSKRKSLPVSIELHGQLTRGLMVVDWRAETKAVPNVDIVLACDTAKVQEIWETMTN